MYFLIVENKKTNKVSIKGNCKSYSEISYILDEYLDSYNYVLINNCNEIDNIGYYLLKNDDGSYNLLHCVNCGYVFDNFYWSIEQRLTLQNYKRKKQDTVKLSYAEVVQQIEEMQNIDDL